MGSCSAPEQRPLRWEAWRRGWGLGLGVSQGREGQTGLSGWVCRSAELAFDTRAARKGFCPQLRPICGLCV